MYEVHRTVTEISSVFSKRPAIIMVTQLSSLKKKSGMDTSKTQNKSVGQQSKIKGWSVFIHKLEVIIPHRALLRIKDSNVYKENSRVALLSPSLNLD